MPHKYLPTLYLTIDARTLKIEKQENNEDRVKLYEIRNLFAQNNTPLILDGFENFSVSLNANYGLSLTLEDENYNINILSTVDLTILTPIKIQGACHIEAPTIINESNISAEQDISFGKAHRAAIINHGSVISRQGKLEIVASRIIHEGPNAGFFSFDTMITRGNQLILNAPMESMKNMDVYFNYSNPNNVISNQLKAKMTLTFHLNDEAPIRFEANNSWGSLYFQSNHDLTFLSNQTAARHINFVATNSTVTIGSEDEQAILRAGANISSDSAVFYFYNGCLLSEQDIYIKTQNDLTLGRDIIPAQIKTETAAKEEAIKNGQPLPKTEKIAIQSKKNVNLESTTGAVKSTCLELVSHRLSIDAAKDWNNISSDITVYDNVELKVPNSTHGLLVEKLTGGHRIAGGSFTCHEHYRTQGSSEAALTPPSTFSVGNELFISGIMSIFASQVSCKYFKGQAPKVTNFTPYTSYTDYNLGGHKKRKNSWWSTAHHTSNGTPILGKFSVGSELTTITPEVQIAGILSGHSIEMSGIEKGQTGEFNWRITLAPTIEKPFRSAIPLVEYFKETSLYQASPEGETVFQSIMSPPQDLAPRPPRLVLQQDGTVSYNTGGLRSIFTPEQEVKLLNDLMMGELSRHFLNKELNDAQSILNYLEANSLEYSQQSQKLLTQNTTPIQQEGAIIPMSANDITNFKLDKPCIANAVVTFAHEDGTSEEVLCPIVFLPESLNNKRLRDGAGCVFSLGDVKFMGAPGGQIEIRGNIDSQGIVTYQNFESVSRVKNTWVRYQEIDDETKSKKLFGGSKTTTHKKIIAINELQPGNSTVAQGERYIEVGHIHRSGAEDILGSEGLCVEKAISFEDHAIIQPVISAPTTKNQRGLLGGRTTTTSQTVYQQAIGSTVQSIGPIKIQAQYGRFDATQFNTQPTFDIPEFHFHEILRAIKAHNHAIDAHQAEQTRTSKRKRKKALIKLAVSLPFSYYLGGVTSGWLGNIGVTGAKLAMAKAATMSAVSSAIQGQKPKKVLSNAFKAGTLAGMDYGLKNTTLVNPGIVKELTTEAVMGSTNALLYHGNILENILLGRSGAVTLNMLRKGTLDDCVIHIGSCIFGATIGETLSDLGSQHGQALATSRSTEKPVPKAKKALLWQAPKHRTSSSTVHNLKSKVKHNQIADSYERLLSPSEDFIEPSEDGSQIDQIDNTTFDPAFKLIPPHNPILLNLNFEDFTGILDPNENGSQTDQIFQSTFGNLEFIPPYSMKQSDLEQEVQFRVPQVLLWQAPKLNCNMEENLKDIHHFAKNSGVYLLPRMRIIKSIVNLHQRGIKNNSSINEVEFVTCELLAGVTETAVSGLGGAAVIKTAVGVSAGSGFIGTGLAIAGAMAALPVVGQAGETAGDLAEEGCHRVFKALGTP